MNAEYLKSVLEKARDQYDGALRWTTIIVIVFLIFHLFIFTPFLQADKQMSKVEARLNSLPGIQLTVVGLSNDLTQLSDMATESLSKQLERMLTALRSDFVGLSSLIERIRANDEMQLSKTPDVEQADIGQLQLQKNIQESNVPNLMVQDRSNLQMQQISGESIQPKKVVPPEQRFGFDNILIAKVREVDNIDELTRILLLTIEEKIIAPRFYLLNQAWRTEILPEMKARSDAIQRRLNVAEKADTSEEAPWKSILAALENTMRSAKDTNFSPPANRFWWITVAGKGDTLNNIDFRVRKELDKTNIIKEVTDDLAKTIADQRKAETKLKSELERIKKSFDKFVEQQAGQLVGLPVQFGGIPIDIISLVSRFPLLIGLVLAALLVWQTRRLSDLILAVAIVKEDEQISPLATWTMGRIIGSRNSHTKRLWSSIGFAIAAWLWIGVSSWELAGWRAVTSTEATQLFLISGITMTFGFVYRWRVTERILASIT